MSGQCAKKYDAVIVPGGGMEPCTGLPQPWVRARLDLALTLEPQTKYFVVLSRGTTHRPPPLDTRAFPIDEAAASAKYLLENGVSDANRILLDSWSLDTIGNAYFTRKMICDPLKLKNLLLVTSEFHMQRTKAIFDWIFSLDDGNATLDYAVSSNLGLSEAQSSARVDREKKSLRTLMEKTIPEVSDMEKLAKFVMLQHGAYNAKSRTEYVPGAWNDSGDKSNDVTSTY